MSALMRDGVESCDVLVIGGGAAGAVAAIAARRHGVAAACISRGPGATFFSSGAVDFRPGDRSPFDIHEYDYAFDFARETFPGLGLGGAPADGVQPVLPTALGTWKRVLTALSTQVNGDLAGTRGGEILAIRFPEVDDGGWNAAGLLARHAWERFGVSGLKVRVVETRLTGRAERLSAAEAAMLLDSDHSLVEALCRRIANEVAGGKTRLVLVEPVMGVCSYRTIMEELSGCAGVQCAEMLAPAPSVPGLRWRDAVEDALRRAGVPVIDAAAIGHRAEAGRVVSVRLAEGREFYAKAFVLATGRFIGGGIARGDAFSEPVFGLPVSARGGAACSFIGDMLGRDIRDFHAAMSAGIAVDWNFRPLNREGGPAYENLFAAGSVVGNIQHMAGVSGLGQAIISGFDAAAFAAAECGASPAGDAGR